MFLELQSFATSHPSILEWQQEYVMFLCINATRILSFVRIISDSDTLWRSSYTHRTEEEQEEDSLLVAI